MLNNKKLIRCIVLFLGLLSFTLSVSCLAIPIAENNPDSEQEKTIIPTPVSPTGTSTPTIVWQVPSTALPSPTSLPLDSGWDIIQTGLERRTINITSDDGTVIESLYILRINPSNYRFDVAYNPDTPRTLQEWGTLTAAQIVVNGGYFSLDEERYHTNGLLVVDGIPIGSSYGSFAGMLAVTEQGPKLRWLAQQPYSAAEPMLAGLQSFPLLVKPGGVLGFPAASEDNLAARRTVIAQDIHGRILFLIAPLGHFTLHKLSKYLVGSDLELDIALNLDGGPSSGIYLAPSTVVPPIIIPAYSPLPTVITVFER